MNNLNKNTKCKIWMKNLNEIDINKKYKWNI